MTQLKMLQGEAGAGKRNDGANPVREPLLRYSTLEGVAGFRNETMNCLAGYRGLEGRFTEAS
jgi:hypothetical protein